MDLDTDKQHLVEAYDNSEFTNPDQFSTLLFSTNGKKLTSLRNIHDIESGTEQVLKWTEGEAHKPSRISSVRVAPELSCFAIVIPTKPKIGWPTYLDGTVGSRDAAVERTGRYSQRVP